MSAPASGHRPRTVLTLAWMALLGIEILTQLSLKFAGRQTGHFDFSAQAFVQAAGCGWLWLALGCYCAGFLVWMLILGRSELSRAYPTSAIVFVAIMLASWLVLNESVAAIQWIGAITIVAGILQLGGGPVESPDETSDRSGQAGDPPPIITE